MDDGMAGFVKRLLDDVDLLSGSDEMNTLGTFPNPGETPPASFCAGLSVVDS